MLALFGLSLAAPEPAVSPTIAHPSSPAHIGGVRLPDCFGDLLGKSAGAQWWYLAGHAQLEDSHELLSIFVLILRSRGKLGITETVTNLGVGDPRDGRERYHHFQGLGGGSITGPTWRNFSVAASAIGIPMGKFAYSYLGGGDGLGLRGGTYRLEASARATTEEAGREPAKTNVQLELGLEDERGTMLEGYGGAILDTYEFAQPQLRVVSGRLSIGSEELRITNGSIWNDMQTKFGANSSGAGLPRTYQWVVLSFLNGVALQLSSWYDVHPQQWISGEQVGETARTGTGTLWRSQHAFGWAYENGGFPLVPRHSCNRTSGTPTPGEFCPYPPDVPWDFSVDLLNSSSPAASPHWTSPTTNTTYATALTATFGKRVVEELGYERVFIYSIVSNTEMTRRAAGAGVGASSSVEHVGAVRVFDRPREDPAAVLVGTGVLEQYGYN